MPHGNIQLITTLSCPVLRVTFGGGGGVTLTGAVAGVDTIAGAVVGVLVGACNGTLY